jgi:dihydrofolate reductase
MAVEAYQHQAALAVVEATESARRAGKCAIDNPVLEPLFAIFALGQNDALGRGGRLPWNYPEDAKHFDDVTRGHAVIMGRRTWEERGVPLADRENLVVSSTLAALPGARVVSGLTEAIEMARVLASAPFVIGGARLLEEAMPNVTRVYLTRIPESPHADVFFRFDPAPFTVASSQTSETGLVFLVLERAGQAELTRRR